MNRIDFRAQSAASRRALYFASALTSGFCLSVAAPAKADDVPVYQFNIAAKPLSESLHAFSDSAAQQIIYSEDVVHGIKAPALRGSYTSDQALKVLLAGTNLTVERTQSGTIMVKKVGANATTGAIQLTPAAYKSTGNVSGAKTQADISPVYIQVAQADTTSDAATGLDTNSKKMEEVIVTGSQIRGIEPTGASILTIDTQAIKATGALTNNDILASIPQIQNFFNQAPSIGGNNPFGTNTDPIARPNLRDLPASQVNAGTLTLIMVDGHRITPAGLANNIASDPNTVPSALLERVEIMPDGASAIYGSDAVGGVINFVTKSKFEGFEASGHYGAGIDGYAQSDFNLTAGSDFAGGKGNIYGSVGHSQHDPILGDQRSYIHQLVYTPGATFGLPANFGCSPVNVTVGGVTLPLSSNGTITNGSPNRCDGSQLQSFYSQQYRDTFNGGVSYELADNIHFNTKGFYTRQQDITYSGGTTYTSSGANPAITAANSRFYAGANAQVAAINPALNGLPETVTMNLLPATGPSKSGTVTETWQATPTLTWDVNDKWQVRALATYGQSSVDFTSRTAINSTITSRIASGQIDPYDIADSAAGAFENIYGNALQRSHIIFQNYRVVADGPVFTLPGGAIHLAAGAEYIDTNYNYAATDANFTLPTPKHYDQNVKAVFGELQVPVVGEGNRMAAVYSLTLSAAVRYDDYNDFGSATNPNLGITYKPVEWVSLRGVYGTSFVAPSPTAQLGVGQASLLTLCNVGCAGPLPVPVGSPAPTNGQIGLINLNGSTPNLVPETSKNWSVGFDVKPPVIPGLTVGATLYQVTVHNILQTTEPNGLAQSLITFPSAFQYMGGAAFTPAQIAAFTKASSAASLNNYVTGPVAGLPVIELVNDEVTNIGLGVVRGMDFNFNYVHPVSWGAINLSFTGNHEFVNRTQDPPGPADNLLHDGDIVPWKWAATAGTTIGDFHGQLTWNHTAGYPINAALNNGQSQVGAFNTVNMFFTYQLNGQGLAKDVTFSLNINNVFNGVPPVQTASGFQNFGYAENNSFTIGRLIEFGVDKKF